MLLLKTLVKNADQNAHGTDRRHSFNDDGDVVLTLCDSELDVVTNAWDFDKRHICWSDLIEIGYFSPMTLTPAFENVTGSSAFVQD